MGSLGQNFGLGSGPTDEYAYPYLTLYAPLYTKVKVPHQLSTFTELYYYCYYLIKDLATASLPEYVATHSHQTDYLAPLRTPHH